MSAYPIATKIVYEVGGKTFTTYSQAKSWAVLLEQNDKANICFSAGGSLRAALEIKNPGVPWPVVFAEITITSRFCIPHWQCSDLHCYTIAGFSVPEGIMLIGEPPAGQYSNYATIELLTSSIAQYGVK